MIDKNVKVIDVRFIACKAILIQLLKLIGFIQYSLENSNEKDEIVLTIRIKNKYKTKLSASVDDTVISQLPHNGEFIIGE